MSTAGWGRAAANIAVCFWFVGLAVLLTYPLIHSLDTVVPGNGAGDNISFLWNVWWVRQLSSGGAIGGTFQTDALFAPWGSTLVLHTHAALETGISAVLLRGVPIVRAHNLVLLAGLALNGIAAYRLAAVFTPRVMPAVLAGTSFATCAFISVHLIGHFNLVHAWVLPLTALAWVRLVGQPSTLRAVAVALAFAATTYTDYYYLVYVALFAVVWGALVAWAPRFTVGLSRFRRVERALLSIAAVALVVAAVIRLTSGVAFDIGSVHVSASHARNPMSLAGLCGLAWLALRVRVVRERIAVTTRSQNLSAGPQPDGSDQAEEQRSSGRQQSRVAQARAAVNLAEDVDRSGRWNEHGVAATHALAAATTTTPAGKVLAHAVLAAAMYTALILPLAAAAIDMIRAGDYVSQQYLWRSAPRGVDLATVVLGPPLHGLSGGWTRTVYARLGVDAVEQVAWLGVITLLLLIAALRWKAVLGPEGRRWLVVCAIFAVWALGPFLVVGGQDTGILLPQTLARYLPIVSNARMPGRAVVMVQLSAAVLAALVISHRRWRPAASVGLIALIVVEGLAAPYPLYSLPVADAVDARMAAAPPGAVIELPSGIRDGFGEWGRFDHRAQVHQMTHGRPLAGGFVARVPPSVTRKYREQPALTALFDYSAGAVSFEAVPMDLGAALRALNIHHLVVNTDVLKAPLRSDLERRGLRFVLADRARELYAVE